MAREIWAVERIAMDEPVATFLTGAEEAEIWLNRWLALPISGRTESVKKLRQYFRVVRYVPAEEQK